MLKIIQINLNHCEAAHDLLMQTTRELQLDVVIISEPYKHLSSGSWLTDKDGKVALWACGKSPVESINNKITTGFVKARIGGIYFYSCYAAPSLSIEEFNDLLDNLVDDAQNNFPVAIAVLFPQQAKLKHKIVLNKNAVIPPVTHKELIDACNRIGNSKAPGLDGIPNVALKQAVKSVPGIFLETFDACLKEGIFPTIWKRQRLVLLPKVASVGQRPCARASAATCDTLRLATRCDLRPADCCLLTVVRTDVIVIALPLPTDLIT
ncbi:unnamed protein product [Colias eurytheme]|nr:unnamed protein product [Colias eurytheme]